jgi:hypothetical protein
MRRSGIVLAVALAAHGCGERLVLVRLEPGPPLRLEAARGYRINARLQPALELSDGTVLRFDSPELTPDSAYFAAPPTAAPPSGVEPRGTLRVSVCATGEEFCRLVVERVAW